MKSRINDVEILELTNCYGITESKIVTRQISSYAISDCKIDSNRIDNYGIFSLSLETEDAPLHNFFTML